MAMYNWENQINSKKRSIIKNSEKTGSRENSVLVIGEGS